MFLLTGPWSAALAEPRGETPGEGPHLLTPQERIMRNAKKRMTAPTHRFKNIMSAGGRKDLTAAPAIAVPLRNKNVAATQPAPKEKIWFRLISAAVMRVENTPPQNTMVKGFEPVKIAALKITFSVPKS